MADQVIDENEDILNEVHDKMDHGPPHDHFISESLQSWILLPCLLIFLLLLGKSLFCAHSILDTHGRISYLQTVM